MPGDLHAQILMSYFVTFAAGCAWASAGWIIWNMITPKRRAREYR